MFGTLLESRTVKARNSFGTAVSATAHGMIIVAAAYATASATTRESDPPPPTTIIWTKNPEVKPSSIATHRSASPTHSAEGRLPSRVSVSIDVPDVIPDINVPLGAVTAEGFPAPQSFIGTGSTEGVGSSGGTNKVYDPLEVDKPASAIAGTIRPEYPLALRSSGMQGEVVAQFVVDESGRAQSGTLRILSATNELFAAAVERALPRMRFVPARIGSKAVAQLVQQGFVFVLH